MLRPFWDNSPRTLADRGGAPAAVNSSLAAALRWAWGLCFEAAERPARSCCKREQVVVELLANIHSLRTVYSAINGDALSSRSGGEQAPPLLSHGAGTVDRASGWAGDWAASRVEEVRRLFDEA